MLSDFQTGMMTETQVIDAYYRIKTCRAFNTNITIWLLQQPPLRRNYNNILQFYNEIIHERITEDEDEMYIEHMMHGGQLLLSKLLTRLVTEIKREHSEMAKAIEEMNIPEEHRDKLTSNESEMMDEIRMIIGTVVRTMLDEDEADRLRHEAGRLLILETEDIMLERRGQEKRRGSGESK